MVRIGKLTDYAIVLSTLMAENPEHLYSVRELSTHTLIPSPTVSKVLKQLVRAGILSSERGVHGGYRLAAAANKISVAQVIEAMEGPIAITECSQSDPGLCSREEQCGVRTNWEIINAAVFHALSAINLEEMSKPLAHRLVSISAGKQKTNLSAISDLSPLSTTEKASNEGLS